MRRHSTALFAVLVASCLIVPARDVAAQGKRPLRVSDLYHLRDVRDPQISPDGGWVAYAVSTIDSAKDKSDSDLWMSSWDGTQTIRLTSSPEGESSPRWSPDGRYIAFLSGRQEGKGAQVWLLDRRGGEAQRITQFRGGVSEFAWSPDSKRLLLVVDEETDSVARKDTSEKKSPKPIVIDRYGFKRDVTGYLGTKRSHLSVFDVETKKTDTLTIGLEDDDSPSWSPDGRRIAFVRGPVSEPERPGNDDIYVMEARAGAAPRRSGSPISRAQTAVVRRGVPMASGSRSREATSRSSRRITSTSWWWLRATAAGRRVWSRLRSIVRCRPHSSARMASPCSSPWRTIARSISAACASRMDR
jgi:dipeptidyl aminopeptidase/acylaminoacyl peptidase